MRVMCTECGGKARIGKTERATAGYAKLYCSCLDPECGHTFVAELSFSHTLTPSAKTSSAIITELCKALPPEQRQQLQQELSLL